jgi:hypothetical protein
MKNLIVSSVCRRVASVILPTFIASATLLSCGQTHNAEIPQPEISEENSIVTVKNLSADSEDRFTLFSLERKEIVPNADSASARWDIGFRKTTIIVNGGKIRVGKGGIQRLTNTPFTSLGEAPASGYRTDEAEDKLALVPRSGEGWYLYSGTSITPIADLSLALRLGDGERYAKIEILSYYKDMVAPSITAQARWYAFRYEIAPAGSRAFRR